MKIAYITRSTLYTAKGGDTIQVIKTATQLARWDILVDIKLTNEPIDYSKYDLLHFFNLTRPADICYHIRQSSIPFVVSPILINYSQYDSVYRSFPARLLFRWTSIDLNEYIKTIARWLSGKDHIKYKPYIFKGQRGCIFRILNRTAMLLPNSIMEGQQVARQYGQSFRREIIPNGIDPALFTIDPFNHKDPYFILCVGRIEGIKNQYNLIKALNNTPFRLVIVGAPAPNQHGYYKKCRKLAASNITFVDHIPQEELIHYFKKAKVHILPSWFETCGLSSLEAASMGCNIVITDKGYTREYFEDYAFYCDPASPTSIRKAIEKAALAPFPEALRKKILMNYTWQKAAEKTLTAYKKVLGKI